jgi:hypothetical protein
MVNWNRQEQTLTQGQPPGSQVVARTVQISELTTPTAGPSPTAAAGEMPADPHVIAQRVFELLRADLRVERERRGLRR